MLFAAALVVAAHTAHETPNLTSSLESAVLAELNRLRANPAAYARELKALRAEYRGDLFVHEGHAIKTSEGVAALDEAVAELERTPSSAALTSCDGLAVAAHDQVVDEGATGAVGHRGSDGSNSRQRIQRHGSTKGASGEVIDYGWNEAKDIVVDLLIDDGIANRGHRKAILRGAYAQAGVACGAHAKYGVMCVVEMAQDFNTAVASR